MIFVLTIKKGTEKKEGEIEHVALTDAFLACRKIYPDWVILGGKEK